MTAKRYPKSMETNWAGLETEIRAVLKDHAIDPTDALRCIDEIVARYTGRGNSMYAPIAIGSPERTRLENTFPLFFNWEKRR